MLQEVQQTLGTVTQRLQEILQTVQRDPSKLERVHIDLNAQKPSRFDQDLRFGSEDIKGAFFLVKLL